MGINTNPTTPGTRSYGRARAVKAALAPKRRNRPVVENHDYATFARRVIRAQGRRIATGDIEELSQLLGLEREVQHAIHIAVTGLRTQGYSWADVALRIGITRAKPLTNAGPPPARSPGMGKEHHESHRARPPASDH